MACALGFGVSSLISGAKLRRPERCLSIGYLQQGFGPCLVQGRASRSLAQSWRVKQRVVIRMSVDLDDSATEGSTSTDDLIQEAAEDLKRELDPRRGLEERYAVINTGQSECRSCGYVYDSKKGDSNYPIPGGIPFSKLPEDWRCPTCGAAQSYFQSTGTEVAGFAQNQSYGLGGNSMTESQKSLLIYGSLAFFFGLFLAGYLLQ